MRRTDHVVLSALCALAFACSETQQPATDAGDDRQNTVDKDSSLPMPETGPRLIDHDGATLATMKLGIVYIGDADAGGAPGTDPILSWLVGSPYWLLLDEYGIGNGTLVGSVRVPTSTFFQPGDTDVNGLVDVLVLQSRIAAAIHGDADAGIATSVVIPNAEAYLVLLPDGVNVALGHRGTYTYQTCIDANGYHGYDGIEPYAVLPPCPEGRTLYAASHELAEVATDPQPYQGWVSDVDLPINGGEVADLCAEKVMQQGVIVTRLWSNQANGCVP
jgi:hypothetical protein